MRAAAALVLALALAAGCGTGGSGDAPEGAAPGADGAGPAAEAVLRREVARIDSAASAADSVFRPLPLLTPGEEASLRSFLNAAQLARARALGVERGLPEERLAALEREGELVPLPDGEYWVVRDLDHSRALVVPGVRDLLTEIGGRFHARLAAVGAPPYRMEITSVLRTASDQEALRRVNPNAASEESTHEYGTTVDVAYGAFAAPADPVAGLETTGAEWTEPYLRRYAEIAAERVAARRALELKAILGRVLIEAQREGRVMVTLERQQPVYHMTLAGGR